MEIGERLRSQRKRAGLSIGQVAEYENISKSYVSDLERGVNDPPTWYLLARLAERYRTTTDYLLGLTDDPYPRRDKPLPDIAHELIEVLEELSDERRAELLAHARVLYEAEQRANVREYQRMRAIVVALPDGERLAEVIDDALRASETGGLAAATAVVDAFLAERAAREALEEKSEHA